MIKKEDLVRIIELNKQINYEIKAIVKKDISGLYDENISIIQSINLKMEEDFNVIKYPIKNKKLGGFVYKTDNNLFCFVNSNQPRNFQNFVLIHEYYHLTHDNNLEKNKINTVLSNEEESIVLTERKANYYASLMLLESLRENYNKFIEDRKFTLEETLCYLIDLYKVPKKTILIRLYELNCINFDDLYNNFDNDVDILKIRFTQLGLDCSILEPSNVIKFDDIDGEFKKARETGSMLESFLDQNESYYKKLFKSLEVKFKSGDK
ncbi:ImmA/IrrE family metallo-endopeptidase [Clostridium beijerinckii]|uniref:ImmA/IrrE family metallo-endopeptidase n=1 Tax=Clostridium beijerinckii TaxID=1520 RepID=UPI0012B17948|nr:ImmA/IrrE family metallo-endopeptidase [Clostridium beijerinckii]MRY42658.1 ImmA/IrrE family metallo-endopeptidase [Parabacteroides distasonis]MZK52132.1 ImmA/IrrE family metallo-endopeptidase [Clostridium beijerinckii]MZK61696.1 ImmA/IrrE family metallo-endopeptidase [Clostridium beijerinckii]MZK71490.1 ImmA/IrrE family metallo-endopeptidase [Clostridium beijerinckii]MZK76849.1 ImmA/IrrE family metallo-endopeptidase [Clostridium beijerinckii]